MTTGDWIALAALAAAFLIYLLQRASSRRADIEAALTVVRAVHNGMPKWGDGYFVSAYDLAAARDRARADSRAVLQGEIAEVYVVPTSPIVALIDQGGRLEGIHQETIEAANYALWQIGVFNQLAQQLADFVTAHAADIVGKQLSQEQREALADAAFRISWLIHSRGIGPATWYADLKSALGANIEDLQLLKAKVHFYAPWK